MSEDQIESQGEQSTEEENEFGTLDDWEESDCDNAVRVNGCPDSGPFYRVPVMDRIAVQYEIWCSHCVGDAISNWDSFFMDGDEVCLNLDDYEGEVEYVSGEEMAGLGSVIISRLFRNESGELVVAPS